jgi:RNase P subunit RPR2
MTEEKLCRDCDEEIDARRLRLFPLADKCCDCAAPSSSEFNKRPDKHLPREQASDFDNFNLQPTKVTNDEAIVTPKKIKIDVKSYNCPFCESKVKVRQLSRDQYKLSCKECGWSDYFPPRRKNTNLFYR